MKSISINNIDLFQIREETSGAVYYGCSQEWYRTKWQRMGGCGPTTATNLIYYHLRSCAGNTENAFQPTKSSCLALMEEVWDYVTPTLRGVSTTKLFCKGVMAYAEKSAVKITASVVDVPKSRAQRPDFGELLAFLDESLKNDLPVAFLNLDNGAEERLDAWHWVTIAGLEYAPNGTEAVVDILDEGMIKKINLLQWFRTTSLGGGFVSLSWN
jgi:hypothetical protein